MFGFRSAESYDALDSSIAADALGFPELRRQLLAQASGQVLELAVGTGLNLPLYDGSAVQSLSAVDISSGMLWQVRSGKESLRVLCSWGHAPYTLSALCVAPCGRLQHFL